LTKTTKEKDGCLEFFESFAHDVLLLVRTVRTKISLQDRWKEKMMDDRHGGRCMNGPVPSGFENSDDFRPIRPRMTFSLFIEMAVPAEYQFSFLLIF
jgi:hypothetical protein